MKTRLLLSAALSAGALGALDATAATTVYQVVLNGASESPAVATFAGGAGIITIDDVARTMSIDLNFAGLKGPTTMAHIHCCTATSGVSSPLPFDPAVANAAGNAGVATQTPSFGGFPLGVTFGVFNATYDMNLAASWNAAYITANGGTTTSAFNAFLTGVNGGRAYFNIHTTAHTGGEVRGFLTPIPEPGTYAMMLGGLAAVGYVARRRKA